MTRFKFLLLGTSLSFLPTLSLAQCVATQDCVALGYTETSCNGGKGVKCPFGNKWACLASKEDVCREEGFTESCTGIGQSGSGKSCGGLYAECSCASTYQYACIGTGYAGGAGSACGGKYAQCMCASGYEWKDGSCQQKAPDYSVCKIGMLFYSDGTCSSDKLSGKELLGVVIYEKTVSESGWVMTVKPVATAIVWSTESVTTGVTDKAPSASCPNTQKLVALGGKYPAANAANNYNAGGKQWCLPSYDLLNNIDNQTNFTKVNNGIRTAGGTILGNVSSGSEYVWSSSEFSTYGAWFFLVNTSGSFGMGGNTKGNTGSYRSVRPVFAF